MYEKIKDYRNLSDNWEPRTSELEHNDELMSRYLSNQNIHLVNTPFEPKWDVMSHEKEWIDELDNRPANSHFHADKGYKFDVLVDEKDKYIIQNERLGDPDTLPDPLITLFRYSFILTEFGL